MYEAEKNISKRFVYLNNQKEEKNKKKVRAFLIDEFEIEEDLIHDGARLKEDLGIDSLDLVDIVVIVQKVFGFKINLEEMKTVATLREFCDYIEKKVG